MIENAKYETWSFIKAMVDGGNGSLQYFERPDMYEIIIPDGGLYRSTILWKPPATASQIPSSNSSDLADFETNYKPSSNRPIGAMTSDNRIVMQPDIFPDKSHVCYTSRGDDISSGVMWGGAAFFASITGGSISTVVEWQFKDFVRLAGGFFTISGSDVGDWLDYRVYAPSSAPAETANPGSGGYNKAPVGGGINMYVPDPSSSGSHDLDLTSTINANVGITKVVPIPADGKGYFDYDFDTGIVSPSVPGSGRYYLFDQQRDLSRFLIEVKIVADDVLDLRIPSMQPKIVLPHWVHRVEYSRVDAAKVDLAWQLLISRRSTTG